MAKNTKKIKILSKGTVTTSRGRCRTPILNPYVENVNTILNMLATDKANIVEVLPDGREVELNIYNCSDNNSAPPKAPETPKSTHILPPSIANAGTSLEEALETRPLTRKERRALERAAKLEAEAAKAEAEKETVAVAVPVPVEKEPEVEEEVNDPAPVEKFDVKVPEVIEKGSSVIEEDAISE